ncbi:MAG: response regulator [Pseudomonadota bacterium]
MKKILVVDDNPEIRDLLERTLARGGYETVCARNGEEALMEARSQKPDLILMDIMMPGTINGTQATRMLKSDPETKYCIVVILTGMEWAKVMNDALDAGADGFVAKPFSPLELLRQIEEFLEQAGLQRGTI